MTRAVPLPATGSRCTLRRGNASSCQRRMSPDPLASGRNPTQQTKPRLATRGRSEGKRAPARRSAASNTLPRAPRLVAAATAPPRPRALCSSTSRHIGDRSSASAQSHARDILDRSPSWCVSTPASRCSRRVRRPALEDRDGARRDCSAQAIAKSGGHERETRHGESARPRFCLCKRRSRRGLAARTLLSSKGH
jgi:hypothetical protein